MRNGMHPACQQRSIITCTYRRTMLRRSSFRLPLLIALIGLMLLVRMVNPHRHQHLRSADGEPATIGTVHSHVLTHLADIASPHSADDLDHDVKLLADEGTSFSIGLEVPTIAILILLWLAAIDTGSALLQPERRRPLHRFRIPALPPPLRGPPAPA